MKLIRSLPISVNSLLRHKLRSALAMLGLVIGVAVVLVMVAIGEGAKREVLGEINRFGTDMLVVSAIDREPLPGREPEKLRATSLVLRDSDAIVAECASVVKTAPVRSASKRIKFGPRSTLATVLGTTPEYEDVRKAPAHRGRYFTAEDNASSRRVALVGTTVAKNLFMDGDPIGSRIRVGDVPFEVIGVLASKGTSIDGNGDQDNQVLVPIQTAMRRLLNADHLDRIYVQTSGRDALHRAETDIVALLRNRHELNRLRWADDFSVEDQARVLRAEVEAADSFTAMIAGMAGISLFIGGVGILSILLITVKQRVGEIGLRMAIGARPRDILTQFMFEALLLSVSGGAFGLLLGLAAAFGIGEFTEWTTYVPVEWSAVSLGASLVLGIVAGVYPARKAALMNPIDALRAE